MNTPNPTLLAKIALGLITAGLALNYEASRRGRATVCSTFLRPVLHVDTRLGRVATVIGCGVLGTVSALHLNDPEKRPIR